MANDDNKNNITSGGRIRKKKTGFTQVQNTVARDEAISLKAKGMYLLIQSYITLEDFDIYKGFLMSMCKEKETAFESTWKELKDSGYLKQFRIVDKNNKGKIVWEYELLDEPDLSTPAIQTVIIEKEDDGQETLEILDSDHTLENMGSGENDHTPENPPHGNSMPCNMDIMDVGGDINNTNKYNTDISNTIINKTTTAIKDVVVDNLSQRIAEHYYCFTRTEIPQTLLNIILSYRNILDEDLLMTLVELSLNAIDNTNAYVRGIAARWIGSGIKTFDNYFDSINKNS